MPKKTAEKAKPKNKDEKPEKEKAPKHLTREELEAIREKLQKKYH
jgi:hypothetical protein